jgi:hypothetical protein
MTRWVGADRAERASRNAGTKVRQALPRLANDNASPSGRDLVVVGELLGLYTALARRD